MENPPKGPKDTKTVNSVLERRAPASLRSKAVVVLSRSGLTVGDIVTELSSLRVVLLIQYNQKKSIKDDEPSHPNHKSLAKFPDQNQFSDSECID